MIPTIIAFAMMHIKQIMTVTMTTMRNDKNNNSNR